MKAATTTGAVPFGTGPGRPAEDSWRVIVAAARHRTPREPGFDTGWRNLPETLVETPRGGTWRLETEAGEQRAGPGQVLVVGRRVRHRLVAEARGAMASSWALIGWERSGWALRVDAVAQVVADERLARDVEALCRWWARAPGEGGLADEARGAALGLGILAAVASEVGLGAPGDERVARAAAWAAERLAEPLRRADLARVAGVSEAHLQELFRASLGESPMAHVQALRLRRAASLLAGTTLPVRAVAAASGFVSPYYFSRFFRARTGLSPRAYRRAASDPTDRPKRGERRESRDKGGRHG